MESEHEGEPGTMPRFAGRYVLGSILKRGNGVETYAAVDEATGLQVVVKTIDPDAIHAAARMRFEHETHVLQQLTGAGLTSLHDAGTAAGLLYLVQPYVPGSTLEQRLAQERLDVPSALRVGLAVATALEVAHGAGICHRDVKPANVMVEGDRVERVTLIDFGFARSPWLDESIRDDLVGTVRYLAPESAGLLAVPADERSDLYATGVLLFECLAGRVPFQGPTVSDLLRQHLSTPPPELHELGVPVPRAVDAVLQRLLRKEPAERYQSASALIADLQALLDALDAGETEPRLVIGQHDQRGTLTDPAFVGRDAELAALGDLVRSVANGGTGLLLLEADSGGGKSRLLNELLRVAGGTGARFLHGQGVAQAAQRPFTLLHGVANDLVTHLDADARQVLVGLLGDAAPTVVRALPSLAAVFGPAAEDDTGPEQFGEQRSLVALHQLLSAVSGINPVVLVLDDCQWADGLTVRLLGEVFGAGAHPPPGLGVIAAFRSEEVAADHPLRAIAQGVQVQLSGLAPQAMAELAESMAGPLPPAAVATVTRLADGSPFMGAAVLRGLVETGALVGGAGGWTVDADALRDVQTARRSAAFLVRRLELLSPESLRLLSAGAVLGKEFDIELAVQLVGSPEQAGAIIDEARRRRLVWLEERTGRCTFAHDKIREALLDRLDSDTRGMLHSFAASALLKREVTDEVVFDLAYHLDAAGRAQAALPHALRAAEIARARHGLDSAVAHYRMAERGVGDEDTDTQVRVAEGLGDVLTLQGVYREAEEQLSRARSLVVDRVHAAALEGKLGDLAFKQGDVTTARRHLEGAMRRLGRQVPQNPVVQVLWVVWEVLVQAAHTAFPRWTTGRRQPDEQTTLAMRLYSRLAYLYWFHSGKVMCAWAHLRGMNLAERYPPSAELGQAWSEHAPAITMVPWFSRALRYVERSLQVRTQLGDVWGQGQSRNFAGVALYAASRFEDGAEACRESLRLLESTGDRWESLTASWNLAMCLHRMGDLQEATRVARDVYETSMSIGDTTSGGIALSVWARATNGDVDPRLLQRELDRGTGDAATRTELLLASAICAFRTGDLDLALRHLDDAKATIRRAGLRQEYVAPVAPWRATVLRRRAEEAPQRATRVRRRQLRDARRAVRGARFWAFSYRNQRPHAYRETGIVAALCGRPRKADRWLRRSLDVALAQGAAYEAALTELAMAELLAARTGDRSPLSEVRAKVSALEVRSSDAADDGAAAVSVFDRFTTLLSVGRTIASATTVAAVELATREAAQALLRGERCHLISVGALESDELVSESGEAVDEISHTLLERAVMTGAPVVATDATADGSESLLLSGLRSVLAAPVVVHGEVRSLFYVTHRHVGQLFGEEEVQLAAFVATLAGAAFEHLEGSESRFRSLARSSSDVLTLVDADGVVSYQSPAATRVFGLAAGALLGRPVEEWVHPADLTHFTAALASTAGGAEVRVECRFRHADGSYRFAETALTDLLHDPTVNALVLNTRDVTDRRRLEDELRERALHDELTGLPNRAMFLERLQHALDQRDPQPLVVCFLDLDDFKAVNDTLGHGAGDTLLSIVAERLSSCLRPGDTVARFGGDEFAVLLEATDLDTALTVAERILDHTAEAATIDGTLLVPRTSIGLAPSHGHGTTGDQLLAEADAAMYAAKARGSHSYEIFDPAMRVAAERRSRMRHELDRALADGELRVHFQPIVGLLSGDRLGVEALVRWQHPERGLLLPGDFVGLAEESGQITGLGSWVLSTACDAATELGPDCTISVNVSAQQLQHAGFVGSVARALEERRLPAARLVLEITETAALADLAGAIARLEELKALGVQLALDDFGTGYAPLSYLRRFPVDYLKIDRSFVAGISTNDEDRAIVRGVIEMAHALGLRAVAEGVEDTHQLQALQRLGCDLGQGYYWLRPGPLSALPGRVPLPRTADDLSTQKVPPRS